MADRSAAGETPNTGVSMLQQGPFVSTPTPSARSAGKTSTPRKAPSSARSSVRSQRLHQQLRSPPKSAPCGQTDEEFLRTTRQVDGIVHAIHADNTKDHAIRLQQAYQDLSRGLTLPVEERASPSKPSMSKDRCRDFPSAVGPVPGSTGPNRTEERRKKKASPRAASSVAPPWGPERANLDRPPWEQVHEKKQHYCKILDQQTADKSYQTDLKTQQEKALDQTCRTSFESQHHRWGMQAADANRERAIYREHLATVHYRKKCEQERSEAEKQDGARLVEETERKLAWHFHVRREEEKQEKESLAAVWKAAAKDRRKLEEAQKAAVLKDEKETVKRMNEGMLPARRIRRPKEECIVAQEAMPVPYRAPARVPRR